MRDEIDLDRFKACEKVLRLHQIYYQTLGIIEPKICWRAYFDPLEQCGGVGSRECQFSFETLDEGEMGKNSKAVSKWHPDAPNLAHFGGGANPDRRSTIIQMLNLSRYPNRRVSKHVPPVRGVECDLLGLRGKIDMSQNSCEALHDKRNGARAVDVCVTKHVRMRDLFDVDKLFRPRLFSVGQTFFREGFSGKRKRERAYQVWVEFLFNLGARLQRLLHDRPAMASALSASAFQLPKLDVHPSWCERSW